MPELLEWAGFEQLALRSDIVANASRFDAAERSETMRLRTGVEYVQNRTFSRERCVGDQHAVTPPRNSFGAHDRRRLELRQVQQVLERFFELTRFHVVSVGAETRVFPKSVVRVAPSAPTTAE